MIFVFGSNREGRHGKGAALTAMRKHGAKYGVPAGRTGNAYAIVTKELRQGFPPVELPEVASHITGLLVYARAHPELRFFVTRVGCGLAGFTPSQIAPLFVGHTSNVVLPDDFILNPPEAS